MLLSTYLEKYSLEHGLAPNSLDQMQVTIRNFRRFLETDPTLADLNDDTVNRWLKSRTAECAPQTVRNNRRNLICLWRGAFEAGLIENLPRRVRKVRCPSTPPRAWSTEQVQELLKVCRHVSKRRVGEIPHELYWRLFINITWDTALRCGDVLALRLSDIGADGQVVISQRKTGWDHICQLQPGTVEMLKKTLPTSRKLAIPWDRSQEYFRRQFTKLVRLAGIPPGTSKWLRRSSATALEALHPGSAMAHLGHRTPGIAYRNYVDPRLLQYNRPSPKPLCVPSDPQTARINFVPEPPTPKAPTHYGLPIGEQTVVEKLERGESLGGREFATAARHMGVTYKQLATETGLNVKHLGQILRGNLPLAQQTERKIRRCLLSHLVVEGAA